MHCSGFGGDRGGFAQGVSEIGGHFRPGGVPMGPRKYTLDESLKPPPINSESVPPAFCVPLLLAGLSRPCACRLSCPSATTPAPSVLSLPIPQASTTGVPLWCVFLCSFVRSRGTWGIWGGSRRNLEAALCVPCTFSAIFRGKSNTEFLYWRGPFRGGLLVECCQ